MNKSKVLITGCSGYIGLKLIKILMERTDLELILAYRKLSAFDHQSGGKIDLNVRRLAIGDISSTTNWHDALEGIDTIVHIAGLAHVSSRGANIASQFMEVNARGTTNLAKQAVEAGVSKFIFISSVGVYGSSRAGKLSPDSALTPCEVYAQSKLEAENGLRAIEAKSELTVVIVRPPMVYGPNAPGNFKALASAVSRGIPLPFLNISNKRSFVYVGNLVDMLESCIDIEESKGKTYNVSDDYDVSTLELIQEIANALNIRPKLFGINRTMLQMMAKLCNKSELFKKTCDSLVLDIRDTKAELQWTPPYSFSEAVRISLGHYENVESAN